jgi:predicted alpha/beta superfamily hydrolase
VLYLQDGQNLFDDATAFAGSWQMVEAIDAFADEVGGAPIVVGIPNAGERRVREYSPFVDRRLGGGGARLYLRFLLDTVRPAVARAFAIAPGRAATAVGGSSLGGAFALWSLFAVPEAFGAALAMSPTTRFAGQALRRFVERAPFPGGRLYLDCGLEEGRRPGSRSDAPTAYVRRVRALRRALVARGFVEGESLDYREAPGDDHSEAAWSRRLPAALRALYVP